MFFAWLVLQYISISTWSKKYVFSYHLIFYNSINHLVFQNHNLSFEHLCHFIMENK